jgi:hypothetical protein
MSEWLERELSRELAPVAAPHALSVRLGFAPAKRWRWEFPRLVLAVATAVILVIGGGYAASRTAAVDAGREAADAGLPRCDGGVGMRQLKAGNATVLLAHAGSAPGRVSVPASDAGCHLCHTL